VTFSRFEYTLEKKTSKTDESQVKAIISDDDHRLKLNGARFLVTGVMLFSVDLQVLLKKN